MSPGVKEKGFFEKIIFYFITVIGRAILHPGASTRGPSVYRTGVGWATLVPITHFLVSFTSFFFAYTVSEHPIQQDIHQEIGL